MMASEKTGDMFSKAREMVSQRLKELRISAREASRRAGLNVGYAGDFLADRYKTYETDRVVALADALDIKVSEMFDTAGTSHASAKVVERIAGAMTGSESVPLYAPAFAANVPFIALQAEPVGAVPGYAALGLATGGYALTVFNALNEPRFYAGETVYVSPSAMVSAGDYVVVRIVESGAVGIGRLADIANDGAITLTFFNAADRSKEQRFAAGELAHMHRIMGSVVA